MATSSRSLATVVWVLAVGVPLGTAAQPTHDQSHARSTTNAYEVGAVVVVDDVQDRVFEGVRDDGSANVRGTSSAPRAREVVCSVTAGSPPQPITSATGHGCTLRGALELALAMSDIPGLILLSRCWTLLRRTCWTNSSSCPSSSWICFKSSSAACL